MDRGFPIICGPCLLVSDGLGSSVDSGNSCRVRSSHGHLSFRLGGHYMYIVDQRPNEYARDAMILLPMMSTGSSF